MRNLLFFLSIILLIPMGSYAQSLGNADFQCVMDSAVIHQSRAKIPCTSLYPIWEWQDSIINPGFSTNPSSEYLKHFPDQYTPI